MIIYSPSGVPYFDSSITRDWLNTINTCSGNAVARDKIWYACPPTSYSAASIASQNIGASGYRIAPFFTPPYYTVLKEIAVKVTATTIGIPTASGNFALYDNVRKSSYPYLEYKLFPRNKIWQHTPFDVQQTGIYVTGVNIVLNPNSTYWLSWIGTRTSTMLSTTAGSALPVLSDANTAAIGGQNPSPGYNIAVANIPPPNAIVVTPIFPQIFPDGVNTQMQAVNVHPLIFYRLEAV